MRSVNSVTLLGNLAKDAEQKFTGNGTAVASLTVATNRRVKKGDQWADEAEFTRVTLWRSENIINFLTKGKPVFVQGRLQTRSYDKDGQKVYVTEVVADDVILLGGGEGKPAAKPQYTGTVSGPKPQAVALPSGDDMEDCPF